MILNEVRVFLSCQLGGFWAGQDSSRSKMKVTLTRPVVLYFSTLLDRINDFFILTSLSTAYKMMAESMLDMWAAS